MGKAMALQVTYEVDSGGLSRTQLCVQLPPSTCCISSARRMAVSVCLSYASRCPLVIVLNEKLAPVPISNASLEAVPSKRRSCNFPQCCPVVGQIPWSRLRYFGSRCGGGGFSHE